jgi:hypothetical protein
MANELDLKKIIAPKLNQAGYGANLGQVFDNIDTNFKIIGNKDFVKGDRGFSLKSVQKRLLADSDTFNEDGIKALKAILKLADTSNGSLAGILDNLDDYKVDTIKRIFERKDDKGDYLYPEVAPVSGISMIDYINYGIVFNVIMSYDPENEPNSEKVVGSLNNFAFKDARYVHAKSYSDSEYESRFDFSCLLNLYVDGDKSYDFQTLQNTPTLYYDKNVKCFCWKVSGIETGIIAQGPQGADGEQAKLYIVKVNTNNKDHWESSDNGAYKITHYLNGSDWTDQDFPTNWYGSGCVAFGNNAGGNPPHLTFISSIGSDNTVFCSDSNSVHPQITANAIKNGLFLASYESELLSGLFLPIDKYNPDSESELESEPVHLLWGVPKGSDNLAKRELHITPLDSYSSVNDIGNKLAILPSGTTLKTADERLNVLYNKCYPGASIVLDYPEVIIKGQDNDGSFLGIGVSYKKPLYIDEKEKHGPRLKLGASGVLEVGTDNNEGLLCVQRILSSLEEQAPLDLESSKGIINLGIKNAQHEINTYGILNVFDSVRLVDDNNKTRIFLSYDSVTSSLQFENGATITEFGEDVLEINSENEISLQSESIKIGRKQASSTKDKETQVDCFNTQFNMEWNIDNIGRDMQVGGQFDSAKVFGLPQRINQIWLSSDLGTKTTDIKNKTFDKTVYSSSFSEFVTLATIKDTGLVDLSKINNNKSIKISVVTDAKYKVTGTHTIWWIKRYCDCNVSLYCGNKNLWQISLPTQEYTFDDDITTGSNAQRKHTFDFTAILPNNLKHIIDKSPNDIKLKISTSFWYRYKYTTLFGGGIEENNVSNRTYFREAINGSVTVDLGSSGTRRIHSEYLNGGVLLGAYKHRNIGIYCEVSDEPTDATASAKNNQIGLFMSFTDLKGNPCWTTIPAKEIFKVVYGNYPELFEAGAEKSPLKSF